MSDCGGDRAGLRDHVPTREHSRMTGLHVVADDNGAVWLESDSRHVPKKAGVGILPQRHDHGVRFEGLELTRRNSAAVFVEAHHFDNHLGAIDCADGPKPVDLHAFFQRFVELEAVRRHLILCSTVNNQRLCAESSDCSRRIHRGVAGPVDGNATADARPLVAELDVLEELQRIVNPRRVVRGNLLPLAEMRANRQEHGIEAPVGLLLQHVHNRTVQADIDTEADDACDLGIEHFPRQSIFRNPEVHHAAGHRPAFVDRDRMSAPREVPCGGEAARTGADDEDPFAGGTRWRVDRPLLLEREISDETLDGMDGHRFVDLVAVAGGFARVIADAAVHGRQGIVAQNNRPRFAIAAGLRFREPRLDVLAGRARIVARRQAIDVERPHGARWCHGIEPSQDYTQRPRHLKKLPPEGGRLRARLKVATAPPASGSFFIGGTCGPASPTCSVSSKPPVRPDRLKADRLKGGGFRPGTLD